MSILTTDPPAGEQTPPVTPDPTPPAQGDTPPSVLGEDGSFSQAFYDGEKLAPHKATLERFKTPEALAEGYANLKKLVSGKNLATPPLKDADATALAQYRQINGIPETHEGYQLATPENLPEGIEMPDGALEQYQKVAHALHLTPDQAQGLMDAHIQREVEQMQGYEQQQAQYETEQTQTLKQEWGADFEANKGKAQEVFSNLASKAGVDMSDSPLLGDALFVKLMHAVSNMVSESKFVPTKPTQSGVSRAEANRIMTDPSHADYKAFHNPNDPRNAEVVAKVSSGI